MRVAGYSFENEDVILDFHEFVHCNFTNCRLIIHGFGAFSASHCNFIGCRYEFSGPSGLTIKILTELYRGGAKELVESIIKGIREGSLPS